MNRGMCVTGVLGLMLMAALVAVTGCREKDEPQIKAEGVSKEEVKQKAKEAYEATKEYTQEQVRAFRQATETQLAEYEQKIDRLQESAEKLGGDAKMKAEQQLAALRRKRDAVSEEMKALVDSGGSAWDQLKSGIDAAMEDLADAYTNAAAEFSKP